MRQERILAADAIRALPKGTALAFATGLRAAMLDLRPWYLKPGAAELSAASARASKGITERAIAKAAPKQSDFGPAAYAPPSPAALPDPTGDEPHPPLSDGAASLMTEPPAEYLLFDVAPPPTPVERLLHLAGQYTRHNDALDFLGVLERGYAGDVLVEDVARVSPLMGGKAPQVLDRSVEVAGRPGGGGVEDLQ